MRASMAGLGCLFLVAGLAAGPTGAGPDPKADVASAHHDLAVRIEPAGHQIEATDRFTWRGARPSDGSPLSLVLNADLRLEAGEAGWTVVASGNESPGAVPRRAWSVAPADGKWPSEVVVPLRWSGRIHRPPASSGEEYARSFATSPGTIGEEGVALTGASAWVPRVGDEFLTFRLDVDLPAGWDAVSQGRREEVDAGAGRHRVAWNSVHPMEEIYLVANRFTRYTRTAGAVVAEAYLLGPDAGLAGKYLDATASYLDMYRRLIGPYPFAKFALVENFWETGYGMPSFTLLGPQVIRLPFILTSSYPHEILHNWWGNSVYVDAATGNWCEGLTAYEADHLIREGQGRGAEYRRDTLKKYRNYVHGARDFPLSEFLSRHSGATEAIGYGKSLMVFHMMRRRLGDARFTNALQAFYRDRIWHEASWDDLAHAFSAAAGEDLSAWVAAWVRRAGAPVLSVEAHPRDRGVRIVVRQTQAEEPWPLSVPVAVTVEGRADAVVSEVSMTGREASVDLELPGRAVRVDLDPEFDVFRRLDLAETPATLSELFGAEKVSIVLPAEGKDPLAAAWRPFAKTWATGAGGQVEVVVEDAIQALPADRAVWVLGATNRWREALADPVARHGGSWTDERMDFSETQVERGRHATVLCVRRPQHPELAIGWVSADDPAALPGLARKLPHYGKYSWLAFTGSEPENVAKGEWSASSSPMVVALEKDAGGHVPARGALPERAPLARVAPVFDGETLLASVRALADPTMEGRGVGTSGLAKAEAWVAHAFAEAGLSPGGGDGTFLQEFVVPDGPDGVPVKLANVVGVIPGTDPALRAAPVVLGAHYDHLGRGWPDVHGGDQGKIHPGADDNASGVAVVIAVARSLVKEGPLRRPVVCVAFSGEEWGLKGSRYLVAHPGTLDVDRALAMVNLDTVGRLGDAKLLVLGTSSATEWRHVAMGIGYTTGVESTCVPDDPQGSDQVAFAENGIPAVQLFTGAHADYHRPTDTIDKIDAAGLAKVATWTKEAVSYLANRDQPLTSAGPRATPQPTEPRTPRRASLGIVPAYGGEAQGPGVAVEDVLAGSAAAEAGILAGDVLLALDGQSIPDLKALSDALRRHAPGDRVRVTLARKGEEIELAATLKAR